MDIQSESELGDVVSHVRDLLSKQSTEQAQVLALHGDLGAGKTTFMQYFARALGVEESVTSPTFVIMKNYELEKAPYQQLVHIDAYRIEDVDEMRPLGFGEILEQKGTIVAIEWAEKIAELLPPDTVHVTFSINGEGRTIDFQ